MPAIDRMRASQGRLARHFAGAQVTLSAPSSGTLNADLSVTLGALQRQTVACKFPRENDAKGQTPGDTIAGQPRISIERALLTVEPQPGWIAELGGEQYRVARVVYLPGQVRLELGGGGAEGTPGG